jgi:hypothetical protein
VINGAGRAAFAWPLFLFFSSCGYVGDPLPPLANIPRPVESLAAVQRGARMIVHFTPPQRTTEDIAIKTPLRPDLRIGAAVVPFSADVWAQRARQIPPPPSSGPVAEYDIPIAGFAGQEVTVGVRVIGSNGKESGWNFINLPVVAAPPTPAGLTAEATPDGVRVTWRGDPGEYHVFRRAPGEKSFTEVAKVSQPEWTDRDVAFGKPYTYLVQRLVTVGNHIAQSELSDPFDITPQDRFAPAAPAGLRAIAAPQSIELAWDRSPEPDLAGYRVYRAVGDGAFEKLADISQLPTYSDRAVEPGKTYRYQVTALDQAGNESPRSGVATATL